MEIIRVHPITQDLPLPGHYPCLTAQLNVTRYQSSNLLRAVLSVREPSDHLEVYRASLEQVVDSEDVSVALADHVLQTLAQMRWMQNGRAV